MGTSVAALRVAVDRMSSIAIARVSETEESEQHTSRISEATAPVNAPWAAQRWKMSRARSRTAGLVLLRSKHNLRKEVIEARSSALPLKTLPPGVFCSRLRYLGTEASVACSSARALFS